VPEERLVRLLAFNKVVKNSLRGFADFELGIGLILRDCPVRVEANGRAWIGLAGKAQIDRDGNLRRKPGTDKPEYVAVLKLKHATDRAAFARAVTRLLLERHPDALDPEGSA
jgi:hypothetical protein